MTQGKIQLPQDLLDNIITNIADAVIALDAQGNILAFNRASENIYGVAAEYAMGKPFAEIGLLEQRMDPVNDLILEAIGHPNELLDKDIAIQVTHGAKKHLQVRTGLLRNPDTAAVIGLTVVLSDITERVLAAQERAESGMFLITVILSLVTAISVNGIILREYAINPYSEVFSWVYMLIMLVPVILYIYLTKMPLRDFGITLGNWQRSLFEGVLISAGLFIAGFLAVSAMQPEDKSIWDLMQPARLIGLSALLYIPHTIVQEVVSRGVILGAMSKMFRDQAKWVPIALSALIFGFLHVHIGLVAVLFTFGIGLLFGWMYLRQQNLIGVILAHVVLGWSAYLFGLI